MTNTGNGFSSSTRKSQSYTEAPTSLHLSTSSLFLLLLQPRIQKFRRLRRPVQQFSPFRHCQKIPISPITHDIIQHLLQQLPKQCLRVRQRRFFLRIIVTGNRPGCQDRRESLAGGFVHREVLDEGYEELIGGRSAGLRFGEFRRYDGHRCRGGEGLVPDC